MNAAPLANDEDSVDALVVGSTFLDIVMAGVDRLPDGGEELWARGRAVCAGGVANNAVATARLGRSTAIATAIGDDFLGDLLFGLLEREEALSTRLVQRTRALTPLTIAMGDGADRAFLSHGDLDLIGNTEVTRMLPRSRTCFLSLRPEPAGWVAEQRSNGSTVIAGLGFDEYHGWSTSVLDQLSDVDVLVCNEVEARAYARADDVETAIRTLADRVALTIVTLGAAGSVALEAASGRFVQVDAVTTKAVDATGAGDAFVAGVMDALLHEGAGLDEILRHASLVAALTVEGLGGSASSPTAKAVAVRAISLGDLDYGFESEWQLGSASTTAPGTSVPVGTPSNTITSHKGETR